MKNKDKDIKTLMVTEEVAVIEEVVEPTEEEVVEPTEEETEEETKEEGVVEGCAKLNVREAANKTAGILCVINKGDVVAIDRANSTDDFYKVITNNEIKVEGYCVKDFIKIK